MRRAVVLACVVATALGTAPDEALSLLQKRAAVLGVQESPSVKQLLASDAKLHKFSAKAFKWSDKDGNDIIDREELAATMQHLFASGVIDRLPTHKEQKHIDEAAGDYHTLTADEFTDMIKRTAQAMTAEDEATSLLQVDDTPSAEQLLSSPAKLSKFATKLFKWADKDGNKAIGKEEREHAFQHLLASGVISRTPNDAERVEIEAAAGDDQVLNLDEFTDVVKHTARHITEDAPTSLLQVDDTPSAEQLLSSPAKLSKFATKLFKWADKDGNNAIGKQEESAAFQHLLASGIINRFPNTEERAEIEEAAGVDQLLSLDEFKDVIEHAARDITVKADAP